MSKADDIRKALAGGKSLTKEQIAAAVGFTLNNPMTYFARGELISAGPLGNKTYRLNPDRKDTSRAPSRPTKRKKRLKGHMAMQRAGKAARSGKTLADIAARLAQPSPRDLALDNYIGASELLRTALRDQVEGLDDNPMLVAALAQHERAEKLVRAA